MDLKEKIEIGRGNTYLICGWCGRNFFANTIKDKWGDFQLIRCPHCKRELHGSKIELTGNIVGAKHIHLAYKNRDVAY